LSKLGRDLSRTIIVDNRPENFASHPDNGLYIKTWREDIFDQQLYGLINLLIDIAKVGFDDIREAIHILKKLLKNRDITVLDNPYAEVDFKMIVKIVQNGEIQRDVDVNSELKNLKVENVVDSTGKVSEKI
jgi:hypothetical protein